MARTTAATLLLLVILFGTGCQGYKPLIHPNVPELIINEGDPLEITCTSIDEINVSFPENDDAEEISTSPHELIPDESSETSVKVKFRRAQTVHGDTGYYGCGNLKANFNDKDYNNPDVSWLYVYVRSAENLFVTGGIHSLAEEVGSELILPCRPTSPELHVELHMNYEEIPRSEKLSFDPKIGFTMKGLATKDSGYYNCQIEQGNVSATMDLFVRIIQKAALQPPVILQDNLQHVTKGSSLHVKCTVHIGADNSFIFYWTTPRNTTSRKILTPVKQYLGSNTLLVTSELVEDDVTYDDEGEYTCRVKSLKDEKSTNVYIHVYDPSVQYLNLTSHDASRHYIINASKQVTFSANIDAYPRPTLIWMAPDGRDLSTSSRISIEYTNTAATLKISNVKIEDSGTYILQAHNNETLKYLNFTLEVLAKPWAMLEPGKFYYGLDEKANFACRIVGHPMTNVSWIYVKCLNISTMVDCEEVQIQDVTTTVQSPISTESKATITVDMSGKIQCTACNSLGCDSVEQDVLVSDGVTDAAFGIIEPEQKITEGDDVILVCAASIYNFTYAEWADANEVPLQSSARIQLSFENTNFTHRAILTIKSVKKSDEKDYYCRAATEENDVDKVRYELLVNDPQAPEFTHVNMNETEVTIPAAEAHNPIHLLCHATGMPRPNITWYKDDKPLVLNELQFNQVFHNQELHINFLLEKDSGKYGCVVKNRYGEISRYQKFIVKGSEVSMIWFLTIVALIIIVILLLVYFCIRIRRERMMRKQLIEAGLMHFEEGALDCINPELTVDDQAELLPYDRKWEFPREKLKLGKQLGSGAFGVVMKAEARGIFAEDSVTTVAVKMVRRNAEPAYIRALASELKIMVHLGKHLNVVNLLGACTNNIAKRELLVIVEYCQFGNLHNYLLRHRENFINQIDPQTGIIDPSIGQELLMRSTSVESNNRVKYAALSFSRSLSAASGNSAPGTETVIYCTDTQDITGLPDGGINSNGSQPGWRSNYRGDYKDRNLKPICTQDLLSWAFQVARGMEYLCQRKVLHGDLAARNILLAENNVVKICDFGLAKTMYKDDNYKKKGDGPVPIKWMAIESIRDRVFSTQSDIWSFGIVLWEFFTLAETPYPGMQAEKQYQRLIEGYRMEQPIYATKAIYDIMCQCWKAKPTLRPSFTELVDSIGELLEEGVKMHYVDLNAPYMDMNTIGQEGKNDYLTMMSAPDHAMLASPHHEYVNSPSQPGTDSAYLSMNSGSPLDESGIFSPRPGSTQENIHFQFPASPSSSIANAAHSDGEDAPMLKKTKEEPEQDEDNYLKPIDVSKKREEFVRQREAEKRREKERSTGRVSSDRDSGYCNTPKGLELVDVRVEPIVNNTDKPSVIIRTQDNYVNMPKQKVVGKDVPDSFMNPSYIFVGASKSDEEIL